MKNSVSIDLENLRSQFGNEGKIVGFANKFYTIWTYQIIEDAENGKLCFEAYFNHNLGANNPFEGVLPFCESLKGNKTIKFISSFQSGLNLTPQEFKAQFFSKGLCKGNKISECTDTEMLCWKFNHNSVDLKHSFAQAELVNIKNRALELGCQCIEGNIYTEKQLSHNYFSLTPNEDEKISECTDVNLLCWKFNKKAIDTINQPEFLQNGELESIKNRALELGAMFFNNYLYRPDTVAESWFQENLSIREKLEKCEPFEKTMNTNLNSDGYCNIGFEDFYFENHKYYRGTYYAPAYCLPVDSKGKAKRIKGNTIQVISYQAHTDETGYKYYTITDWKIVK